MDVHQWASISTIGQFVLVSVSIVVVLLQLRQGIKLKRAANAQALSEQACAFNTLLIQDSTVAKIWHSEGENLDAPEFQGVAASERYRELLVQWLILHENIFYQHQEDLLDRGIYAAWDADLIATVAKHNLDLLAPDIKTVFPGAYGERLQKLKPRAIQTAPKESVGP